MKKFYSRFVSKKVLIVLLSFICVGRLWATDVSGVVSGKWDITGSPYVIIGDITIPIGNILTIEPGVIVQFSNNSSQFTVNGTLNAQGNLTSVITFIGIGSYTYQSKKGPITFAPTSKNSVLRNVVINMIGYASDNDYTAAIIINSSSCTIDSCVIKNINGSGIEINDAYPVITHDSIALNTYLDVILDVDKLKVLKNNIALKVGLTSDKIMTTNDTIIANNTYYKLIANQTVPQNKTLTIEPGTVLQFSNNTSQLSIDGTLNAQGGSTSFITFVGTGNYTYESKKGPIIFSSTSTNSILRNTTFDGLGYDKNSDLSAAIIINSSFCTIDSCYMTNTKGSSIEINNVFPKISNNYIGQNIGENQDVILDVDKLKCLQSNNSLNVGLTNDVQMASNDTLVAYNRYKLLTNELIPQNKILIIEAGTFVDFPNNLSQLTIDGTLKALGTSASYIKFIATGSYTYQSKKGPIIFSSISTNSVLQFVTFDSFGYDRNTDNTAVIYVNSSSFIMANCFVINSKGAAMLIENSSSPSILRSCFNTNAAGILSNSGKASINECNFLGNTSFGVKNASISDTLIATNCFWGDVSGPREPLNNPNGGGDIVNGNVIYLPFSVLQYDCSETVILPLTLLNFQTTLSNNTVNCTWQTANETNTNYFIVQRSIDGANFTSLGKVYASGNTSTNKSYLFTDKSPSNGINYYRLQMVDKDGRYSYSKVLPVNISIRQPFAIYPNPVKEILYVQVQRSVAEKVSLQIIDMQGKTVLQQNRELAAGVTTLSVNTTTLTKGSYFIAIKGQAIEKKLFIKE